MDLTPRIFMRLHIVGENAGKLRPFARRNRAPKRYATGLSISHIERGLTGPQFLGKLNGKRVIFGYSLTGRIEGENGTERVEDIVGTIWMRGILDRRIGNHIDIRGMRDAVRGHHTDSSSSTN